LNRAAKGAWIVDVRPAVDYLKDQDPFRGMLAPNKLINIPWTDFLNDKGTADPNLASKLATLGIQSQDDILVLDERSIKSSGATLVLRDLGFSRASTWAGGYRELHAGSSGAKKRSH
jgi:rhodanese-related sulfurtransferase